MSAVKNKPQLSTVALFCAALWAPGSLAQELVPPPGLTVSLEQELSYDSNPFRLPAGVTAPGQSDPDKRSDWTSITRARLLYMLELEGQRFTLNAAPALVRHARFDELDHIRHAFGANWWIKPVENAEVTTNYSHTQIPSDIAEQKNLERNIVTADTLAINLLYGTDARWQFLAGASAGSFRNDTLAQEDGDRDTWSADGGVRYRTLDNDTLDLRMRHTRNRYTNLVASPVADSAYKQNEAESVIDWQLTGSSKVTGRVGYLMRRHDTYEQRDFSGWTGSLRYLWRPNDVSSVRAGVYRQLGEVSDASATYAETTGIQLSYSWAPGGKLVLTPRLEWRQRDYQGFSATPAANDIVRIHALSAAYEITPLVSLTSAVGQEKRDTDNSARRYTSNFVSALLKWQMR